MKKIALILLVLFTGCYSLEYQQEYERILKELDKLDLNKNISSDYFSNDPSLEEEIQKDTVSMKTVVKYAITHNPELLSEAKKWKATIEKYTQSISLPDPKFRYTPETKQSGVSQEIPFPQKLLTSANAAILEAISQGQKYYHTKNQLISEVIKSYAEYAYIFRAIQVNQTQISLVDKLQKIAREKYANNMATQYDVVRAQIRYTHLLHEGIMLEEKLQKAKAKLNELLGRKQEAKIGHPEELKYEIITTPYQDLEKQTLENNFLLKAHREMIKVASRELDLAYLNYWPDFMIEFMRGKMGKEVLIQITAGIDIPIQIPSKQSAVEQAKALHDKSTTDYLSTRNQQLNILKMHYEMLMSAQRRIVLFEDSILPLARQTLELATLGYENNQVDIISAVDAMVELENIELDYYKAIADWNIAWSEIIYRCLSKMFEE